MTILRTVVEWSRPRPPRPLRTALTLDEQKHVAEAVRFLRSRLGGYGALAKVMGVSVKTVNSAAPRPSRIGPGFAIRVARVAGVAVDDVLAGRWPGAGACPLCGRAGEPSAVVGG